MTPTAPAADQGPSCPTCRKPAAWAENPARPFCSITCKLIDLGSWLDERFRLPGAPVARDTESEPICGDS